MPGFFIATRPLMTIGSAAARAAVHCSRSARRTRRSRFEMPRCPKPTRIASHHVKEGQPELADPPFSFLLLVTCTRQGVNWLIRVASWRARYGFRSPPERQHRYPADDRQLWPQRSDHPMSRTHAAVTPPPRMRTPRERGGAASQRQIGSGRSHLFIYRDPSARYPSSASPRRASPCTSLCRRCMWPRARTAGSRDASPCTAASRR
jgi:hypothetical protein